MLDKVLKARLEQLGEMKGKVEEAKVFIEVHLAELQEEINAINSLIDIYKKRPNNDPDLLVTYNEVIAPTIDSVKFPRISNKEKQQIQEIKKKREMYECPVLREDGRVDNKIVADEVLSIFKEYENIHINDVAKILCNKYPALNSIWKNPKGSLYTVLKGLSMIKKDEITKGYWRLEKQ